jgi:hypothetical protein
MKAFTEAMDRIYDQPTAANDPSTSQDMFTDTDICSTPLPHQGVPPNSLSTETTPLLSLPYDQRPYMSHGTFTLPALAAKINANNGRLLLLYDELGVLFNNINKGSKDAPIRQQFLTLADGGQIARTTATAGQSHTKNTNVNFCGESLS